MKCKNCGCEVESNWTKCINCNCELNNENITNDDDTNTPIIDKKLSSKNNNSYNHKFSNNQKSNKFYIITITLSVLSILLFINFIDHIRLIIGMQLIAFTLLIYAIIKNPPKKNIIKLLINIILICLMLFLLIFPICIYAFYKFSYGFLWLIDSLGY